MLSDRLKKQGVKHIVLNAKPEHAQREGETIAEAGRSGSVTIATNMAGRGVDIMLGGNAEHLTRKELRRRGVEPDDPNYDDQHAQVLPEIAQDIEADREKVLELGGLYICGTERHESRRIDNQLRGRAGRQGDPGESRFFLSAEDDLVRLFAGDRIYRILDRLGPVDEEGKEAAIEHGMLTRQIENAQKKVEEQNFLIRKRVLEYDDVLNQQREIIYEYRRQILEGLDMSETAKEKMRGVFERLVGEYMPSDVIDDWDLDGLFDQVRQIYEPSFGPESIVAEAITREELTDQLHDDALQRYAEREQELTPDFMRNVERWVLLQIIDERWREHLFEMDYLREGIHLRGFAQIDPLVAYKNEGFKFFGELMDSIWAGFAKYIFHIEVEIAPSEAQIPFTPSSRSG
jgi:preprotein translocase subunit SecA